MLMNYKYFKAQNRFYLRSNFLKIFIALLLFNFFTNPVASQNLEYKISTLNGDNNITDNVVSTIYKDSLGFLWIGKMDGLYKYNGYDSEVFTLSINGERGISNPWVTDFVTYGDFFAVGTKNGINFLSKKGKSFKYLLPSDYNQDYSNEITCVKTLKNKSLIVGTTNELLQIQSLEVNKFEVHKIAFIDKGNEIKNISVKQLISLTNGFLVNTSHGVFMLPNNLAKATKVSFNLNSKKELTDFYSLYLTKSNNLLISSKDGVFYTKLNPNLLVKDKRFETKPILELYENWPILKTVNVFLEDSNGILWLGTEGEGLFSYHKKIKKWQNYRHKINYVNVLKNDFIRVLYEDDHGMIVIGSDAGVNTIITQEKKFQFINRANSSNDENKEEIINVHAIVESSKRNLWIGTRGKGLFVYNKNSVVNITPDINASLGHIRSIIKDKKDNIWLGTQNGVYIIDKGLNEKEELITYFKNAKPNLLKEDYVYTIFEDNNTNKWISTSSGLYVYTANKKLKKITNTSVRSSLDKKLVYTIFLDQSDRLWFGTLNGALAYLDYKDYDKQVSIYPNLGKPLDFNLINIADGYKRYYENYDIYTISEVNNGTILVGTNFGLCKIDIREREMTPFFTGKEEAESEKLRNSYVYGLLYSEKENKLWASSSNGLSSYDLTSKEINNFDLKDGLQSLEFNGNATYKNKEGKLFFGGANGLNIYDPANLYMKSDFQPNVVLTELYVNGKRIKKGSDTEILTQDISYTSDITLSAKQNTIGFEFASLHLPYSLSNNYKCRLIGIDDTWINLNRKRFINYANLPQGDYRFQLIGTNNDGVWSANMLDVGVSILPAWYNTWYMMTLWYLIAVGIITSFIMILLKNRDKNNELKIKEIERNNLQELYESKLVFFTNLSHELRTPLSLIIDPIKSLIKQKEVYNQNKEMFNIVKNNVERLRRLIDQIMDFRKHEYGKINLKITKSNIVETLASISSSFVYHSEMKNINFKVKLPDAPIIMYYDLDKVEKVVYNVLSNAFKATSNDGKIKIILGKFKNRKKLQKYKVICGVKELESLENHVYIEIIDNGEGIDENHLEEIFTRFYQDKTINSGTGIGLYMVKQLTEMHYGTILIKSSINKGTSFIIILPKNDDLYKPIIDTNQDVHEIEVAHSTQETIIHNDTIEVLKTKKYSVVVVEDNDELRMYLKNILQGHYNVYTANNGLEGLELIKEVVPDVIISDIVMPEVDGIELCKRIKDSFDTSHIPVILLTAKSFDYQIIEGVKSGADIYLTKPFSSELLIVNINNLISNREKLRLIFQNENILEPSKFTVTSIDEKFILKLKAIVEENIQDQQLTLESLATQVGVSRAQLFRKVKALTGLTPNNFIKSIRIKYAAQLLEDEKFQMSEVAFLSGFKEASYFSRCFKEAYGCSPKEYKKAQ